MNSVAEKFQISFSIEIEAKHIKHILANNTLTTVYHDKYTIVYKKNLIVHIYDKWDMVHKYLC